MNVSTLTQHEEPERHELPASLEALPSPVPRPVQWQRLRENLAILRGGDTTGRHAEQEQQDEHAGQHESSKRHEGLPPDESEQTVRS